MPNEANAFCFVDKFEIRKSTFDCCCGDVIRMSASREGSGQDIGVPTIGGPSEKLKFGDEIGTPGSLSADGIWKRDVLRGLRGGREGTSFASSFIDSR